MRHSIQCTIFLLIALCVASTAFSAQNFNPNPGVGPKVKGIQLGRKMSLNELVTCLVNLEKLPLIIDINGTKNFRNTTNSIGSITLEFNGIGKVIKNFEIKQAVRNFTKFYKMDLALEDLLFEIERTGGIMYVDIYLRRTSKHFPDKIIEFDNDLRVTSFKLHKTDFTSKSTNSEKFLQDFTRAYNIPYSGRIRGNIWSYQGTQWKMTFFHTLIDDIILFELIDEIKFN